MLNFAIINYEITLIYERENKMENLIEKDLELIETASETIKKNYDKIKYNHTVAVAVRWKDIYRSKCLFSSWCLC